jgi:hypothetical protein
MLQPNQQQPLPGPDTVNTQILMMLMGITQQQDRLQQHQDLAALYLVQALRSHQAGSAMINQLLQRQEQEQDMNHLFFGLGNGNANLGGLFSNTWPSAAALPPPAGIMGLQGLLSNPLLGNTFPSAVFALSHTQGAAMGQASGVAGGLLSNLCPLLNHNHVIASATQPVQGAADAPARSSDHDTFSTGVLKSLPDKNLSSQAPKEAVSISCDNSQASSWEEQFQALKRFKLAMGHTRVPACYKSDPKLGR